MAKKKGKKGKKDTTTTLPVLTTLRIESARLDALNPRLGDSFTSTILKRQNSLELIEQRIQRSAVQQSTSLYLQHMSLHNLSILSQYCGELQHVIEIDFSRNELFASVEVFEALSPLTSLQKLNLSYNSLNGTLNIPKDTLVNIEELILDSNQFTAIGTSVHELSKMKRFSIANNSIKGKIIIAL